MSPVDVPAYLVATTGRAAALFARHGYTVEAVGSIGDGPPLYRMRRAPRPLLLE